MKTLFSMKWIAVFGGLCALWSLTCCTGSVGLPGHYNVTKTTSEPGTSPGPDGTTPTPDAGTPDTTTTPSPDGTTNPPPDGGPTRKVFFADMKPFFAAFCIKCHSSASSLASLETYDDLRRGRTPVVFWEEAFQRTHGTDSTKGKMPPQPPTAADLVALFEEGKTLFRLWKEAGYPEGDVVDPKDKVFDPMSSFPKSGTCEGKDPLPARLWRLTATQVRFSLIDIFGKNLTMPEIKMSETQSFDLVTKKYHGFSNLAAGLSLTGDDLSSLVVAFGEVAKEILAKVADAKSCLAASDQACVDALIRKYGRRLWRRPLTSEETTKLRKGFDELLIITDRETALSYVFERMMLSPSFLMRSEMGKPLSGQPGINKLEAHELAALLSYTIWQSAPDEALLQAAEKGELATKEQLRKQIDRMVTDPRAARSSRDLFNDWLKLFQVKTTEKDGKLFPSFTVAVQDALHQASLKLVEDVIWNRKGSLEELFSTNKVFANSVTAPFYGMTLQGAAFQAITTKPDQRAGLLTTPAYLSGHGGNATTSLVHRGVFLIEQMTCYVFPPPPPNANEEADDAIKGKDLTKLTARDVINIQTSPSACNFCHKRINPVGAAFELFDPVGIFRTTEKGLSIDASGSIKPSEIKGIDVTYKTGPDLVRQLAKTERFQQCFTTKLYTHTFGLAPKKEQSCMLANMYEHLKGNNFTLSQLYQGLVQTDTFLLRKEPTKNP